MRKRAYLKIFMGVISLQDFKIMYNNINLYYYSSKQHTSGSKELTVFQVHFTVDNIIANIFNICINWRDSRYLVVQLYDLIQSGKIFVWLYRETSVKIVTFDNSVR